MAKEHGHPAMNQPLDHLKTSKNHETLQRLSLHIKDHPYKFSNQLKVRGERYFLAMMQ